MDGGATAGLTADPRHPSTVADWDDARRRHRLHETRHGLVWKILLCLLPVLVAANQYWLEDVVPERDRLAHTRPDVQTIYQPQRRADADIAVVDLVGLGNLDARQTARTLSGFADIGQVWAVKYDNRGIDTKVIADLIVERAALFDVDHIVLVGHSMGGVVALEVAEHIYHDTDRNLVGVILDCTPLGIGAVRPQSRDRGENLLRFLGWLPGARESRTIRAAVEIGSRHHIYLDGLDVDWRSLRGVTEWVLRQKILAVDAASTGLVESQFKTIVASGAVDNLDALAQQRRDKPRPGIVLLRPRDGSRDGIVDVDQTEQILHEQLDGLPGTLVVAELDGTEHANPNSHPAEYNSAISRRLVPFLRLHLEEPVADLASGRR